VVEKTVVVSEEPRFIGAVKKVVSRLRASHGPLYVALLIRLADRPADEWTFLVGSRRLRAPRRRD
jgi:hypothetical protein